jgi:hypothetical protein
MAEGRSNPMASVQTEVLFTLFARLKFDNYFYKNEEELLERF